MMVDRVRFGVFVVNVVALVVNVVLLAAVGGGVFLASVVCGAVAVAMWLSRLCWVRLQADDDVGGGGCG